MDPMGLGGISFIQHLRCWSLLIQGLASGKKIAPKKKQTGDAFFPKQKDGDFEGFHAAAQWPRKIAHSPTVSHFAPSYKRFSNNWGMLFFQMVMKHPNHGIPRMLPPSFRYDPGGFFSRHKNMVLSNWWEIWWAALIGFHRKLQTSTLQKTCPEKTQGRYMGSHTILRLPF